MRKLLVLGAATVALLSLATIAQGDGYDDSHVWFFGDCENQYDDPDTITSSSLFLGSGCRGIGIFLGDWDASSIAGQVSYEAMDEFGGNWEVDYLKAINLFGGAPAIGSEYGCGTAAPVSLTPATLGGGLWIAIFSVVPCEPFNGVFAVAYTDMDENDGSYNPAVDILIAMVTDDDGSQTLSVGDLVTTFKYPLDFDFDTAGFGTFSTTQHVVTAVNFHTSTQLGVSADGTSGKFQFARAADYEEFSELTLPGLVPRTTFQDGFSESWGDYLSAESGTPSDPDTTPIDLYVTNSTNDRFIDVEVYFSGTVAP